MAFDFSKLAVIGPSMLLRMGAGAVAGALLFSSHRVLGAAVGAALAGPVYGRYASAHSSLMEGDGGLDGGFNIGVGYSKSPGIIIAGG
jgi:hypothetical protein